MMVRLSVMDESAASLLGAVSLLPGVTSAPLAHLLSSLCQATATHTFTRESCRQGGDECEERK